MIKRRKKAFKNTDRKFFKKRKIFRNLDLIFSSCLIIVKSNSPLWYLAYDISRIYNHHQYSKDQHILLLLLNTEYRKIILHKSNQKHNHEDISLFLIHRSHNSVKHILRYDYSFNQLEIVNDLDQLEIVNDLILRLIPKQLDVSFYINSNEGHRSEVYICMWILYIFGKFLFFVFHSILHLAYFW